MQGKRIEKRMKGGGVRPSGVSGALLALSRENRQHCLRSPIPWAVLVLVRT